MGFNRTEARVNTNAILRQYEDGAIEEDSLDELESFGKISSQSTRRRLMNERRYRSLFPGYSGNVSPVSNEEISNRQDEITEFGQSSLSELAEEQKKEELTDGYSYFTALAPAEDVLANYLRSPLFISTYAEAKQCVYQFDQAEFRRRLVGAIFADIAFSSESASTLPGLTLLTPKITFDWYKRFYTHIDPNIKIKKQPFGQHMIEGIYPSDGFLVGEENGNKKIIGVLEYKACRDEDVYKPQYDGFDIQRRKFPTLFNGATFTFVVPDLGRDYDLPSIISRKDVALHQTHFTHGQFRRVIVDYIDREYRQDGEPTLLERRERLFKA